MNGNDRNGQPGRQDEDDAPELDESFFERADEYNGELLVRKGRPSPNGGAPVSVPVDADVVEAFRRGGPDWQSRLNAVLRAWLKAQGVRDPGA
jgi:uncharacterized protein (DUF4415 family)